MPSESRERKKGWCGGVSSKFERKAVARALFGIKVITAFEAEHETKGPLLHRSPGDHVG